MERFAWDESFSTGYPSVDTQHKELFYAVNDLADAIEKEQGEIAIKKLLIFMGYYAEWHFEREEKCMETHQCPFAEANKQAHQQFLETFQSLSQEVKEEGATNELAMRIHEILSKWLINHILKIDTNLKTCVHSV